MHEASVGFQCPDCVSEGRRATRRPQGGFGGAPATRPQLTSIVLIAANVAVWLAITLTGGAASPLLRWLALRGTGACVEGDIFYPRIDSAGICERLTAGQWVPGAADGAYWQIISSGFTHLEIMHLALNCFFIFIVGPQLEMLLGRARFLAVYLVSLVGGSVLVLWATGPDTLTLGASGAAYGMMAGLLVAMLKRGLDVRQLLMLIAVNTAFTFVVPGISWQGHLGGFIGGALAATAITMIPSGPHRTRLQSLGIAALVAVAVALIAVRATMLA